MKKMKMILCVVISFLGMSGLLYADGENSRSLMDTVKSEWNRVMSSSNERTPKSPSQPLFSVGTSLKPEDIKAVENAANAVVKAAGKEAKELIAPVSEAFANTVAPAVGEQVKKVAPNLDNNISKVSNSFTSFMSGIKCWPFLVLGAAVSIIGCKIFSDGRDKNRYADEKDHKVIQQSRLHMLEGGLAVVLGCLIMKFSKPLFYHFSE